MGFPNVKPPLNLVMANNRCGRYLHCHNQPSLLLSSASGPMQAKNTSATSLALAMRNVHIRQYCGAAQP